MKVLLTGSSGRIGRAIHHRLVHEGHDVVGYDVSPSSTAFVVADLLDRRALDRAVDGCDAVIHVAALHAPHVGLRSEADFQRINVDGTALLVDAAKRAGVSRFVLTSTTALYGDAATPEGRAGWVDEALAPAPRTIYHRSKLAAEALARDAAGTAFGVGVIRMSRCFPEPANVMAAFRLHRGVDARDVATAHVAALRRCDTRFQQYVISGSTPFEREDVEALWHDATAVLQRRAPALVAAFKSRGWPLPTRIDRVYDPAHAVAELGWRPMHGVDSLLRMADEDSAEVLPANVDGRWSPD
ncbi:MAG: NAD-dependent epimerase/dehydratase family protein [Silanimonas sp.]